MLPSDPPSGSLRIDAFPLGNAALNPDWPEGRFNVSGMFVFEAMVLAFLEAVEAGFGCRVPIEAVHGAPTVLWSGGRHMQLRLNPAGFSATLDRLYSRGVGCWLTFTNHLLEAGDLGDADGNFLLESIAQRPDLNGVIVSSELLSKYIAGRYPSLRQVASLTKVVAEGGTGNASYYNELGKRFSRYVVHPDDYQDRPLLDQLDRTKAEIILNENCLRGCLRRGRHYEAIARAYKSLGDHQVTVSGGPGDTLLQQRMDGEELGQFQAACPSVPMSRQIGKRQRNCNLTPNELKSLYDMGFRCFKLQGRNDNVFCFAYDLARYTLEPGCAVPLIYKVLCLAICQNLTQGQSQAKQERPAGPRQGARPQS